jgi:hypothetical protein
MDDRKSFAATMGRCNVNRVDFNAFVPAKTIRQKTRVHTARCETISRGLALANSSQYSGNNPHKV